MQVIECFAPSNHYTKGRTLNGKTYGITRITPHCIVGQQTAKQCADGWVNEGRNASSTYIVGTDGVVGYNVREVDRPWTSSSPENDAQAITIECASDVSYPYAFNNTVMRTLVELTVDIIKRNGRNKLVYIPDKNQALAYQVKDNEMLITFHRWFDKRKECPGDWFVNHCQEYVNEVNAQLQEKGDFDSMTDIQKELFVENVLYIGLLDRKADEGGKQNWINRLNNASVADVCNQFMETQEYRERTVTVAYERLLNREPDPEGFKHWVEWLKGEKTADDLYNTLMNSEEYKQKHGIK